MKKNVHWSNTVRIITVLVSVLVIVALVTMGRNYLLNPNYGLLLGIIAITITLAVFILSAPMSIVLEPDKLTLKKLFGSNSLKYSQILSVEKHKPSFCDMRIFGSAGFFGYIGIFCNKRIGKYTSFVGDTHQCFLVTTKSGRKYALSCESPDEVITQLTAKL